MFNPKEVEQGIRDHHLDFRLNWMKGAACLVTVQALLTYHIISKVVLSKLHVNLY